MNELPYYKQKTPYTCALACFRMVLESVGKKYNEYELAAMINFDYNRGISMPMMANFCKLIGLKYILNYQSDLKELSDLLNKGIYPIVLINPGILYLSFESKHVHFIVVKHLAEESILINDPDREFGGENKEVNLKRFLDAWKGAKNHRWLLAISGEQMISKKDAMEITDDYLITYVGNLLGAKDANFDGKNNVWVVSIFHAANFEMGEMTIDTEGNVITLKLLEDSPEIREFEKSWKEKYSYEAQELTNK